MLDNLINIYETLAINWSPGRFEIIIGDLDIKRGDVLYITEYADNDYCNYLVVSFLCRPTKLFPVWLNPGVLYKRAVLVTDAYIFGTRLHVSYTG